jgi:hypothetical protein
MNAPKLTEGEARVVLSELARVRAIFQLRALLAAMGVRP